jgi:hypothetical protein
LAFVLLCLLALGLPVLASAHIERASYWPSPAPDRSVTPPAGGVVPKARSLASGLKASAIGETRVVCKANSLALLRASIKRARAHGFDIRPHDHRELSAKRATRLLRLNRAFAGRCRFHEIQPAVTASGNNDRVVIMPGLYTEPTSRKAPTDDPSCADLREENDRGDTGSVSYRYQAKCPNDQNLIAVIGRKPAQAPPQPPRMNRHGIPDLGPCIRCNFQIEGSGVSADDVVIDAGRVASGNHGPVGAKKHVGIRADRADGFVLRNMTVRHAAEHNIYVVEVDGYRLERFKVYYAGEYGVLTFVGDHALIQDCEAVGAGDAGLYPGAAAETGDQRLPGTRRRYNTRITRCDMHHNLLGYSGTDANGVHVDHNNFYDNTVGFVTDVVTGAGHPGYPQDSDLIEHNNIYSNNFNPYVEGSDVEPTIGVPVGTGLLMAGANHNIVRHNRIWNNWRRGVMLFAIPDAVVCGPQGQPQAGCDPLKVSTSFNNEFYDNVMGTAPDGSARPNGLDFWWDEFPGNTGNCWHDNGDMTSEPSPLPTACGNSASMGHGNVLHEAELAACAVAFLSGNSDPDDPCPWFETPPKPGSRVAVRAARAEPALHGALIDAFRGFCGDYPTAPVCAPFVNRLGD